MSVAYKSPEETFEYLKSKLSSFMPEFEIKLKADLVSKINQFKKDRNAIILGHNYMEPALYHGVADIVGDSLQLSRAAMHVEQQTIVFCGVRFMAETAKVLNPNKTVLLPSPRGGCSLASSLTAHDVRELKQQYPGAPVVVYINTYAEVHAEADAVCTSSNAARIVASLKEPTVIFLPDEYLAKNVAEETGKTLIVANKTAPVKPAQIVAWRGKCEVHEQFKVEDISNIRKQFPDVHVLSHPECSPEVVHASDYSGSTSKMIDFVKKSDKKRFLILTECSMGDNIIAENPGKEILRMCNVRCPHMAEVTLEDTLTALKENKNQIEIPVEIQERARRSLDRMLTIT